VPRKTERYNTTDEGLFLAQQAADAKTAMQRTVADMQETLKEAADVRWWTQQYPWYAMGAAAVVGFVAATRVLAPPDHHAQPAPLTQGQAAARPTWTSSLFEMVRSALMSAIMEAVRTQSERPEEAPDKFTQANADVF